MPPLKYEDTNKGWEELLPILQEHVEWFYNLLEHVFYPESVDIKGELKKPTSFAQWVVSANHNDSIRPEIVERLNALHNDLFTNADMLCSIAKEQQKKPEYKQFRELITLFEEFTFQVRRLEKDFLIDGSGFDLLTGLRNKALLVPDVFREMDRLARQGKSFCLALACIDRFDGILKASPKDESDGYIKLLASLIKLSVRSFDDAYYMGDGVFALCLKQTDINGGFSAFERLRKELEYQKIVIQSENGEKKPLSMSCCIAEPVNGDDVDDLIQSLSDDLVGSEDDNVDSVLRYRELSALERYVQDKTT